jgi:prepilin-type N-terminal cleavage/methylation domain-containing protein
VRIIVGSSGFSRFRALPPKGGTTYENAFTLIEVILAIAIAAGLLVVAISYYQRAADLRGQLLAESEKLATIRLLMDRISLDLRTAFAEPRQGFSGTSDYMKFAHLGSPTPGNLAEGAMKLVTYSVITNSEATNSLVIGFNRVETPLVEMRVAAPTNREPFSFNGAMDPVAMATNNVVEPLTRSIRMVNFRYFDGNEWLDAWNGGDLPMGVEVTFGTEPPSLDEEEEYGGELFRRIIFVPAGRNSSVWEELP